MLEYTHKSIIQKGTDDEKKYQVEWNFEYNEKNQKVYQGHRDANIIDGPFIDNVMRDNIGVKYQIEQV